jgi:hypothetical protein
VCALVALAAPAEAEPPWLEERIHPVVARMPASAETSIEAVAQYISARVLDPIERIKALHDWVADRIAYDAEALSLHAIPLADAYAPAVFGRRLAVCAGYADLLHDLGRAAGIEIAVVENASHAWNAVSFAGRRYEIDVTWDAGYVEGRRFVKRYSTQYLFMNGHHGHPDERGWREARRAGPELWVEPKSLVEEPPKFDHNPFATFRARGREPELDWEKIGL